MTLMRNIFLFPETPELATSFPRLAFLFCTFCQVMAAWFHTASIHRLWA